MNGLGKREKQKQAANIWLVPSTYVQSKVQWRQMKGDSILT